MSASLSPFAFFFTTQSWSAYSSGVVLLGLKEPEPLWLFVEHTESEHGWGWKGFSIGARGLGQGILQQTGNN